MNSFIESCSIMENESWVEIRSKLKFVTNFAIFFQCLFNDYKTFKELFPIIYTMWLFFKSTSSNSDVYILKIGLNTFLKNDKRFHSVSEEIWLLFDYRLLNFLVSLLHYIEIFQSHQKPVSTNRALGTVLKSLNQSKDAQILPKFCSDFFQWLFNVCETFREWSPAIWL